MRKLLIIDDERQIVDWLYELLSLDSSLDLEIFRAYSSKEALGILSETKIDVALTDIKMPGMTGLELMDHIYKRWPYCRIIILTGYQSFENIYYSERNFPETIYLMKTEDDDVIIEAVKKQLDKVEAETKTLQLRDEYESRSLMAAQNLFLKNLSDGAVIDPLQFQALMKTFKAEMDASSPFMLVVGKLTHADGKTYYTQLFEIQSIVRKYVSHLFHCAQWSDDGNVYYWLMQPLSGLATQMNMRDLFEDVQSTFEALMGFESSFVVSNMFLLSELSVKAAQIFYQLQYSEDVGGTAVLMEQKAADDESFPPLNLQTLEMLETNLFLGKRDLFLNAFRAALLPLTYVNGKHHVGALELYCSISLILQRYINRIHAWEQLAFQTGLHKLTQPSMFKNWREAVAFLTDTALMLFDMRSERKENYQLQIVGSIIQYIHKNLNGDLSLVTIADKMNYNPSYISRMFKRIEGVKLSDFISAARIGEAKRLLLRAGGGMSMNDIAAAVGYDNPQYFATVFRNLTGLTPHQYQLENLMIQNKIVSIEPESKK